MGSWEFGVEKLCFACLVHGLRILPPVIERSHDLSIVGQRERIQPVRLGYLLKSLLMVSERDQIRRIPSVRCSVTWVEGNGFLELQIGVFPVPHMHSEMSQ